METLKGKLEKLFYDALYSGVAISEVKFDISEAQCLGGAPKIVVDRINVNSFLVDTEEKAPFGASLFTANSDKQQSRDLRLTSQRLR